MSLRQRLSNGGSGSGAARPRRSNLALFAVVGGVVVAVAVAVPLSAQGPVAKPAPRFRASLLAPGRGTVTNATIAGRAVLLNFWASWCAPCVGELGALQTLSRRLPPRTELLGVDTNDQAGPAEQALRRAGVSYPNLSDPHAAMAERFGVVGTPTTILIDARGRIVRRYLGPINRAREGSIVAALREAA